MTLRQEHIQELQFLCSLPEIRVTTATTELNYIFLKNNLYWQVFSGLQSILANSTIGAR